LHEGQLTKKEGTSNINMPHCCAGVLCQHPEFELRSGHPVEVINCRDCGEKLHYPCAIILGDEFAELMFCPECIDARRASGAEVEQAEKPEAKFPRKKRNSFVCEQYVVLHGAFSTGGTFRCKHCHEQTFVWTTWNSSKARSHLEKCSDTPEEVRVAVTESSQASRKKQKTASLTATYAAADSLALEIAAEMGGPPTLLQQYKDAEDEAKKECERLKSENELSEKKLRKCQEKLRMTELFSKHDKTKIENLEKERDQLEELNRLLKARSDDDSVSDLGSAA
jgi:hypothetical protein